MAEKPPISGRVQPEDKNRLESYAENEGIGTSAALREVVHVGLNELQDDTPTVETSTKDVVVFAPLRSAATAIAFLFGAVNLVIGSLALGLSALSYISGPGRDVLPFALIGFIMLGVAVIATLGGFKLVSWATKEAEETLSKRNKPAEAVEREEQEESAAGTSAD